MNIDPSELNTTIRTHSTSAKESSALNRLRQTKIEIVSTRVSGGCTFRPFTASFKIHINESSVAASLPFLDDKLGLRLLNQYSKNLTKYWFFPKTNIWTKKLQHVFIKASSMITLFLAHSNKIRWSRKCISRMKRFSLRENPYFSALFDEW